MDARFLTYLNRTIVTPELDWLMLFLSIAAPVLVTLAVLYYWYKKRTPFGSALVLTLLVSLAVSFLLQYLSMRPRPEDVRLLAGMPPFPSYPSGHATVIFALAMLIWLVDRSVITGLSTLILATAIAVSRIYLGHHWPSDVLGGAILGMALGAGMYGLTMEKSPAFPGWRWLVWPQIGVVLAVTQMAYLNYLPFHLLRWQHADKVLHFLLFGLITFWLHLWLRGRTVELARMPLPLAIVLPFLISIIDESFQYFSPVRNADFADLASNLGGMVFFWIPSHLIVRRINQNGDENRQKEY